MNVKRFNLLVGVLLLIWTATCPAETVSDIVSRGNQLYEQGLYNQALSQYQQAPLERLEEPVVLYNRANCYYKLEDYSQARNLYQEVSAKSKDMQLVVRAKYNLGNCHYQRGLKQLDSDLQKALDELTASVGYYREVLDIDPEDSDAAHNLAVARLVMKDLLDKIKKEREKQQQQQQQNQLAEKIKQLLQRQGELLQKNMQTLDDMPDPNAPSEQIRQQLVQQSDQQQKLQDDTAAVNDEAQQMLEQMSAAADPNLAAQIQQQQDILETVVDEMNQAVEHQSRATGHLIDAQITPASDEQMQAAERLYRALEAFPKQPQPQDQQQQQDQPQNQDQPDQDQPQAALAPETTARDILDREKQRNRQRQRNARGGYLKVDKDW